MCGRYAASRRPEDLVEEFEATAGPVGAAAADELPPPDWNVAPTKQAPVVLERPPRGEPAAAPVRQLRPLTWGLVPSWAKDRSGGSRMINARAESLLDKPAYRRAALARRCLVPADGWFEWQPSPVARDGRGRPRRQPFFVTSADGGVLALAGVYELWRDPTRDADDPAAWLATYAVVTTTALPELERIHDRMPLVLPRESWAHWLDPAEQDPDAVRALLRPVEADALRAFPVSTRVNDVRNAGPELVEPLPVEEAVGMVDPVTGEVFGGQDAALF
jgi:putative SOS response-associated peptidase YedK